MDQSQLDALVAGRIPDEHLPGLAAIEEYRLLRRLGQGGMGCVYLAHDTLLDRLVAIKFLTGLAQSLAARQRFMTEARAIARLVHPNVVILYRIGEIAGQPFLVSEYVRGQSLDGLPRPLPGARVLRIGVELARGLAAAHRRGVLHRDLKPHNAMLTTEGTVKLLDFGLAKLLLPMHLSSQNLPKMTPVAAAPNLAPQPLVATLPSNSYEPLALTMTQASGEPALPGDPLRADALGDSTPELTQAGAVMGTPLYMAPEMCRGEPATAQVDVYSLGAVLYELASGHPPYREATPELLRRAVLRGPPPPLGSLVTDLDAQLGAVIDRCLCSDAAARYAGAEELCQALEQTQDLTRAGGARAPRGAARSNPYRGLRAFDLADSALFFGRRAEISAVLERLRVEPLVLVTGNSGVGKSSLCRAGVLARVLDGSWEWERERRYTAVILFPGRHPALALADALAAPLGGEVEALRQELLAQPRELARRLQRHAAAASDRGLILLIDQIEELVSQSEPSEALAVSEALGQLAARVAGLRVLLTARGDFLTRLAALPGLGGEIGRALYILGPLGRDGLREAIVGPAELGGVQFESAALISELVDSTLQAGGGLPLLQFALAELWEARDTQAGLITQAALRRIGGVTGALSRHADRVLLELLPAERSAAQQLLLRLVTPDGLRTRRSRYELLDGNRADALAAPALEALVRGRLLVAREAEGSTVYEIAHEALVSGWPALRELLGGEAERRALRERLRAAAAEWGRFVENDEPLWRERQLSELSAIGLGEEALSEIEERFLAESRRRVNRQRWGSILLRGGLLLSLLILGLVSWKAEEQKQRADLEQSQRERAQRIELGTLASALAALPGREAPALVAAVAATAPRLQKGEVPEPQALEGLSAAVQAAQRSLPLRGHRGPVHSASFSPDGKIVLTAGWDGMVRRWNARTGAFLQEVAAHAPAAAAAKFSPDGQRVATVGADKTLALWDAKTLSLLHRVSLDGAPSGHCFSPDSTRLLVLTGAGGEAARASLWDAAAGERIADWSGTSSVAPPGAFSPDSSRLVVGSDPGVVRILDARSGEPLSALRVPKEHTVRALLRAGYSPNGQQILAMASGENAVYSWDTTDHRFRAIPSPEELAVFDLASSPDGALLATANDDYAVRLWEPRSGALRRTLPGHYDIVHVLGFSPDGALLASSGSESGVKLWDLRSGQLIETLKGHSDITTGVSFAADGASLLTASTDGSARLWSLQDGQHLLRLRGHTQAVVAATYSADGLYVATAGKDETARIWDAASGRLQGILELPGEVSAVAFGPRPALLAVATGSRDKASLTGGTLAIWEWPERRQLATLRGQEVGILSLAFSPTGELLAAAGMDATVRLWRWRSGEAVWRSPKGALGAVVTQVAFSPDGSRLAAADSLGRVRVWEIKTGRLLLINASHTDRPSSVAYSPDGKLLAISGPEPCLVDAATGVVRRELRGHLDAATAVNFSRDGGSVATLSADQTVRIWDAATGQPLHILRVGNAASVELSPDGRHLLVAHPEDRSAKIYPASPQALLDMACQRLRHQSEWEQVKSLCSN